MEGKIIKLLLLSAITLTACSVQQEEQVTNKRDLIEQVLDLSKAPDVIPAAFFHHFPDKFGPKAIEEHIAFFKATGNDILKVQYETLPPQWEIKTAKDFEKVVELPTEYFEDQLQVIEALAKQYKDSALIIPTVYSPLLILHQAAGGPAVDEVIKQNPAAAEPAFEKLAKSIANYIRAARERGADGFYVSSHGGNIEFFGQDSEVWTKYLRKWDKYISEIADSVAPLNILHICGGEYKDLDAWADYPGTIINLPEFDVKKLRHAQEVFKRPILGGLDHRGVLINGTLEELLAHVDTILTEGPQNLILGANCTVPDSTSSERLRAVIDYAHTWRQTHKK
ncbi:MAG: hypothetical protein J6V87_02575 [Prevotella sp.]|nr:hypothetical protein [Prevotella sp.]